MAGYQPRHSSKKSDPAQDFLDELAQALRERDTWKARYDGLHADMANDIWKQRYESACQTIRELRKINEGLRAQVDEIKQSPASKQAAMEAREKLIPYLDN